MRTQPAKNQPLSPTKNGFSTTSLNSVAGSFTSLINQTQEAIEKYLKELAQQGSAEATLRNYRSDISQFIEFCKIQQLNPSSDADAVEKFEDFQRKKHLKDASIRRKSVSITSFLNWLSKTQKSDKENTNQITKLPENKTNSVQEASYIIPIVIEKTLNQYLTTLKYNTISDTTIRNYRSDIKQFAVFTKAQTIIGLLSLDQLKRFAADQKEKGLKPTSIQRKLVSITQFALWAQRRKLVSGVTTEWSSQVMDTIFDKHDGPIVVTPPTEDKNLAVDVRKRRRRESLLAGLILLLLLFGSTIGLFLVKSVQDIRQRAYVDPEQNQQIAQTTTTTTTTTTSGSTDKRTLPFRGKLYSSETGQQITGTTSASFKLFNNAEGSGGAVWESGVCDVSTNGQGVFDILLGGEEAAENGCGKYLSDEIYFGNTNLWLSTIINSEQLALYPIKTVEYSKDSTLLAGYPIGDPVIKESVLFMNEYGEVLFADEPNFSVPDGDLTLSGDNLYFITEGVGGAFFDSLIAAPYGYFGGAGNPALVLQSTEGSVDPLMVWADPTGNTMGVIDANGNIGLGTESPQGLLGLGNNGAYLSSYGDNLLFYDEANGTLLSLSQLAKDEVGVNYWDLTDNNISYSSGNVSVGTAASEQALTVNGNLQLGTADADRYIYFDNGGTDNAGIRYNSTDNTIQFSNDGATWLNVGNGQVTSITSTDSSLSLDPTTGIGDVDLTLNLATAHNWTGQQNFASNVGISTTSPGYKLEVGGDNTEVVAKFNGRVVGANAVNSDEFVTLSQVEGLTLPTAVSGATLYYNGTDWVAASNLFNDGTNVGIGTDFTYAALTLNADTTAAGGISFGDDTNLYRVAANTLKTDDSFVLGTAGTGTTDSVVTREADGTLTARTIDSRVWGSSLMSGSGTTGYVSYWDTDSTLAAEQYLSTIRGGLGGDVTAAGAGELLYSTGTNAYDSLAAGSASQLLISGGAAAPAWSNVTDLLTAGDDIDITGTTNATVALEDDIDLTALRASSASGLSLYDDGGVLGLFLEDTSGNIGVGTSSPEQQLTTTGNLQLGTSNATRYIYFDNGTASNSGFRYNSSTGRLEFSDNGSVWNNFGTGDGTVTSVTNADGTITVFPTDGDVVASLNLANANDWTAQQTFGANVGIGVTSTTAALDFAAGTTAAEGIEFGGDTNLYRAAADTLKTDDSFVLGTAGTGTTDSVITREADGTLTARDIDSRVWGSSLTDGSGTTDYVTYWSDADTLAAEQYLSTIRGGLGGDVTAAGAGELLYSTGTNAYDSLAAGTASQLLISGGAGAPSWSNIASLLTAGNDIDISGTTNATITLEDDVDLSIIRASSIAGLSFYDDGGNLGLFVADQGNVGVGTNTPDTTFHVDVGANNRDIKFSADSGYSTGLDIFSGTQYSQIIQETTGELSIKNRNTDENIQFIISQAGVQTPALTIEGSTGHVILENVDAGTTDSVITREADGSLSARTADSRIWGSSLVDGSGTANYLSKFSDGDTLTNSVVYDDGTNVGIGTDSPEELLTVDGNLQLGVSDGDRYVYFDNGTATNAGIRYNASTNILEFSNDGINWNQFGSGSGTVTSVTNSDGTLTILPTSGDVVASLNLANANTWTGAQTFNANTYFPGSGIWDTSGNIGIGTTSPTAKLDLGKTGTASSTLTQSNSGDLALTGSFWTGAAEILHSFNLKNIASTTTNEAGRLAFSWDSSELMSLDSNGNLDVSGGITLGTANAGTTDSVITREADGTLTARDIDSRVWGSSLIDGTGTTDYIAYWSDANTLAAEQYLATIRGGLGNDVTPTGAGEILYSNGLSTYDSLAAGSASQLLISNGASAPSWSNITGLLTAGDDIDITGTTNATVALEDDIDLTALRASSASGLSLYDDGGILGLFIEDATGNVGIGDSTPATKLDVAGAVKLGDAGGVYDILNTSAAGGSPSGDLYWGDRTIIDSNNIGNFGVASVTNADGTLTISPTTGNVVASLNLANANNWTGAQTFSANTYFPGSTIIDTAGNVGIGTNTTTAALTLAADTLATGGIDFGGDTNLYRSAADTLKTDDNLAVAGSINLGTVNTGTTNSVITREVDGTLNARDINSKVWGSLLVDGSGTTDYVTYWSDTDTLAAEQYLSTIRGGLGGDVTALGAGEILYSTGTNAYDSLAAGSTSQLLISGGAASPSWSNVTDLLTAGDDIDITGTTNATVALQDDIDLTALRASSAAGLSLYDDGGILGLFIEDATGNVGIGDSTPATKLDVAGAVKLGDAGGVYDILNTTATGGAPSGDLYWGNRTLLDSVNLGSFAVTSVTNSDGTLTISPTTGDVVASLNLANANTWTGAQTFNANTYFPGSTIIDTAGNVGIGTNTTTAALTLAADTLATGGIDFGGDTNIYRSGANTLKTDDSLAVVGSINLGTATAGTTDSVITREVDGSLRSRTADSRIWGSSLVDGSGTADYIAYWSDGNTLTSEQYLSTIRGGLGGDVTALGAGEILYSTGTNSYDSLAAGGSNQLLGSNGAGAPSWYNIASLLTAGDDIDITGTTNATVALQDDIDLTALRASSASGLSLYDDGGVLGLFLEDTSGNIGVGTATPEQKLDVAGAVKLGDAGGTNDVLNTSAAAGAPSGPLYWGDRQIIDAVSIGDFGVTSVTNSDGTLTISPTTGDVVASLNLANANTWTGAQTFNTNTYFPGSTIIDTAGNVGIGTTSPTAKLDLGKTGTASSTLTQSNSGDLALTGSFWTGAAEALHSFSLKNVASTTTNEAGRLAFSWDSTELMSLDNDGNLDVSGGITLGTANAGTTDSVITREVSGDLSARTIDSRVWGSSLVDGTSTAGYVTYWSDGDTITGEQYLDVTRGGLGNDVTALGVGELLYSTGTNAYDSLAAGSTSQLLISGGAGAPSWSNIAGLLTAGDDIDITGTTNATVALENDIDLTALRASSASGLSLYDDGGVLGLFLEDTSGNIGVGTATPGQTLDVAGAVRLGDAGGTNDVLNTSAAAGAPSGVLYWGDRELIDSTTIGGYGVTTLTNSDGTLTISPTTGDVVASLNLANDNTWTGLQTFNNTYTDFAQYLRHSGDTDTFLNFTTDGLLAQIGGETLLTFTEDDVQDIVKLGDGGDVDINLNDDVFVEGSTGNVGIGTTNATYKLTVAGDLGTTGDAIFNSNLSGNGNISIGATTTGSSNINFTDGANQGIISYNHVGDKFEITTNGSQQMVIDASGNIGLGVTSPTAALEFAAGTTVADGIIFGTDTTLYRSAANTLKTSDSFVLGTVATGTTNNVITREADGTLAQRSADSRIWGSSLVDGSGTTNYVTYWSDADTLAAEQYLSTTRGGLGGDVTAAGAGELLYSTGTNAYDSLSAGGASQLLISGGAGAPSWSNIASLLTAGDDIDITGTTNATVTLEDDIDLTALRASSASGLSIYDDGGTLGLFIEDTSGNIGVGTASPEEQLTTTGNIQLGITDGDRYIYFDNGTANNAGFRYNSTSNELEFSDNGIAWNAFGVDGGGVTSVSNADGTLTISPTTGDVVASLNLGNANTWTAAQTFNAITNFPGSTVIDTAGNIGIATGTTTAALTFAADTLAAGGIDFGGDTTLYRSGANTLATDDTLNVLGGNLGIGGSGEIYLAAADTLRTPDSLTVDGTLNLGTAGVGTTDSVITREAGGDLSARTIDSRVWGSSLVDGSGTTNYVTYWSDANTLTAEQYLNVTRGGLGADVTALGAGELLYSTGTAAYDSLAAGGASQLLISGGAGAPSWSNIASLLTAGDDIDITGTTNATVTLEDDIDLTALRASSAAGLSIYDDGGVLGLFLEDTSGNVGVGTASPEEQLTTTGNIQLGVTDGDRYIYFDNGTGTNAGFRYNATSNAMEYSDDGVTWGAFNSLATGGVDSVSNADGTLTISPTTGDVVASLNLANANTWTGAQTFSANTYFPGSTIIDTAGNVGIGTNTTTAALTFVSGTTAADGIDFGGDTTLYRSGANTLTTDDTLNVLGGNLGIGASGEIYLASADTLQTPDSLTVDGTLNVGTVGAGTTDSVITREVSGDLSARTIDSRVWGSSLVDGSGTTNYVTYWSDANTLTAEQYLSTIRGGLGGDVTAAGAGELLYSTGTTAYSTLAAGTSNQLLISGGAGAPSWSNIAGLLTAGDDIDITGTTNATVALEDDIDLTALRASSASGLSLYDDGGVLGLFLEDTSGNIGVGTASPEQQLTTTGNLQLGIADGDRYIYFDNGTATNAGIRYNATTDVVEYSDDGLTWNAFSDFGSGAVTSVTNADGTLTISPTTGDVVASLNLANANTWTGLQTFNNTYTDFAQYLRHAGDADTFFNFTDDNLLAQIGGETLLTLTENGTQDLVKLGDGGDVDINLNDDVFIQGNNGNVGIGTTGPNDKLDVAGAIRLDTSVGASAGTSRIHYNSNYGLTLTTKSGSAVNNFSITSPSGLFKISQPVSTEDLLFNQNGTGNIAIGTTSTSAKLTFGADTTATGGIDFGGDTNIYRSAANYLKTDDNFVLGTAGVGTTDSIITREGDGTLTARTTDTRIWGSSLVDGSGTTNYVTKWSDANTLTVSQLFDNGTNVGVGTATPGSKLYVNGGNIGVGSNYGIISDTNQIIIDSDNDTLGGTNFLKLSSVNKTVLGFDNNNNGTGQFIIGKGSTDVGGTNWSSLLLIDNSGNVGIGTDSPEEILTAEGNLQLGTSDGTRYIYFDNGTATNAGFRYNATDDAMEYSDDGITWTAFNAAGGGVWSQNGLDAYYNTGNVGIGTVTPISKLSVIDGSKPLLTVSNGNSPYGANISGNTSGNSIFGSNLYADASDNIKTAGTHANYGYSGMRSYWGNIDFYTAGGATTADATVTPPSRLFIKNADGNVGINDNTPSYKLDVNGTIRGFGITNSSDVRFKKDITDIEPVLDKVLQLRGVNYYWIDEAHGTDEQIGFIAQELEQYFPDLVSTDNEGYKSVAYSKMTAVLVEAIKEQQEILGPINFNDEGFLAINGNAVNGYSLVFDDGSTQNPITAIAGFAKAKIAELTAGVVRTKDLIADNITIAGQSLADYIKGIVDSRLAENPPSANPVGDADLSTLEITDIDTGDAVLNIDNSGNVSTLGKLTAQTIEATGSSKLGSLTVTEDAEVQGTLTANEATVSGTLVATNVQTDNIDAVSSRVTYLESRIAEFEDVKALTAEVGEATVSGTLYADDIYNFDNMVAEAFKQPSLMATIMGDVNQVDPFDGFDLSTADAQNLNLTLAELDLAADDVVIAPSAVFINDYLKVNGSGYIAGSLGINENLLVGDGIQIGNGAIAYKPTSGSNIFYIQPDGIGTLSLMANLMTLTEDGIVTISGDLRVAGAVDIAGEARVETSLLTNLIKPLDENSPVQVQLAEEASQAGKVNNSRFEIVDELGTPVATISAAGKAKFAGGLGVETGDISSSSPGVFTTTKTAGKAYLPAGTTQVIIRSEDLTEDTLIYVTPLGSTNNQVLYVKNQVAENPDTLVKEGNFVVGLDFALTQDVEFNWWMVQ